MGLVLAGGGARGAYEAGVLSVLLPALARRGERPTTFVGTSVGAINASYLAASSHLPVEEAARGGLERWRDVRKGRVIRPILSRQVPLSVVRYAGELLSLPGVRLPSLLDPEPLEHSLERWIDWEAVHSNVDAGTVDAVAVVATAARSGRSVAFLEGANAQKLHESHVVDYVHTKLANAHVRASAAIPILFPPILVEHPAAARGWYVDGGTRLHTPIKPALDLGVDRIVVVATDAVSEPSARPDRLEAEPPDFGDGALQVLQGMLVDPLVEDMRMLGNVNLFFGDAERAPGAVLYRRARGKPPYRVVPYVFVAPRRAGAIGNLATEVFHARYAGVKGLRSPDFPLLNRLLGGESATHGEFLSYLFFDPEFVEALLEMGREDAKSWLGSRADSDGFWRVGPLETFTTAPSGRAGE